jgi:hypothetical protein
MANCIRRREFVNRKKKGKVVSRQYQLNIKNRPLATESDYPPIKD